MSFTPGPWFGMINGRFADTDWMADNDEANSCSSAPITDKDGHTVALVVSEKWKDCELLDNARLIAAAPELLEALEHVRSMLDEDSSEDIDYRRIARVIAKARGEGV